MRLVHAFTRHGVVQNVCARFRGTNVTPQPGQSFVAFATGLPVLPIPCVVLTSD